MGVWHCSDELSSSLTLLVQVISTGKMGGVGALEWVSTGRIEWVGSLGEIERAGSLGGVEWAGSALGGVEWTRSLSGVEWAGSLVGVEWAGLVGGDCTADETFR